VPGTTRSCSRDTRAANQSAGTRAHLSGLSVRFSAARWARTDREPAQSRSRRCGAAAVARRPPTAADFAGPLRFDPKAAVSARARTVGTRCMWPFDSHGRDALSMLRSIPQPAGVSPIPVQMCRCRCGSGEPSPGADVARAERSPGADVAGRESTLSMLSSTPQPAGVSALMKSPTSSAHSAALLHGKYSTCATSQVSSRAQPSTDRAARAATRCAGACSRADVSGRNGARHDRACPRVRRGGHSEIGGQGGGDGARVPRGKFLLRACCRPSPPESAGGDRTLCTQRFARSRFSFGRGHKHTESRFDAKR
jgi:hypothetical protein